jgi:hypothetical protein
MKSPSLMRNGRFHPPQVLRQASKNGSVVHPFSHNARPMFIIPKYIVKKNPKIAKKKGKAHSLSDCGPRLVGNH